MTSPIALGLTGSTGFLGKEILKSLKIDQVITIGRSEDCDFYFDLGENKKSEKMLNVECLVHCAGLAHYYPVTLEEKNLFDIVNFQGTKRLFESINLNLLKRFVFISTVAVYGCERGSKIDEKTDTCPMTPYGRSKLKTENYLSDMSSMYGFELLIVRLPLLAGKNAPGNLGRMIKSIQTGRYMSINGGKAKRSIVLASDVASFVVSNRKLTGIYNLTDDRDITFKELEVKIANYYSIRYIPNLPYYVGKLLGLIGDFIPYVPFNSMQFKLMTQDLTFSCDKAKIEGHWRPKGVLDNFFL